MADSKTVQQRIDDLRKEAESVEKQEDQTDVMEAIQPKLKELRKLDE